MSNQKQRSSWCFGSIAYSAWFLSVLMSAAVRADALLDEPLALSDRAPLVQRFNLPVMRGGELLVNDSMQWRVGVDAANNFVRDRSTAESLVLDGESQRYELGVRYGLGAHWEIGVMLPWISHNGGALDHFIEGWHRTLGMDDGNRSNYAARQLQFVYRRNGLIELDFERAEAGVGDAQVQIAHQLVQTSNDKVALIASLNLPTGADTKLTGAGGTSAGVLLAVTHLGWLDLPLTLSGNIGAQTLPRGDVLGDRQKTSAWFGAGEIAWVVARDWRLRAQINTHSAIYDSALTSIGTASTQLLLGGSVRLSDRWALDAAVSEDIAVDTAPDVTLQLALRARY